MKVTGTMLKTSQNKYCKFYLYLFSGQGDNNEWENDTVIDKLMTYVLSVKKHPSMTIVMPRIFYHGDADKVWDAQEINSYLPDIVNQVEGPGSWESPQNYRCRSVAGLCLASLCALKAALYWEIDPSPKAEKFFSLGIFSPANEADTAARWIGSPKAFKFIHPENHRSYISCRTNDTDKLPHAERYKEIFAKCGSPVNDFVLINEGSHDWDTFCTGFVDFMSDKIFLHEYYANL